MPVIAVLGPEQIIIYAIIALVVAALSYGLVRLFALVRREGNLSRQENLASVAALLRAPEKATRLYALNLLASFPLMELSAVESALVDLMRDPDPEVRAGAGHLMGLLHPLGQLLKQLGSRQESERLAAINGLALVGDEKALEALLEVAGRDPNEGVRQAAKAALARLEAPESFVFLIEALGSADPILRNAVREIFKLAGMRTLAPLLASLRDPHKGRRAAAAELMGELGLQGGAEALVALLTDPVDEVRTQVARALGKLTPSPGAVNALVRSLSDSAQLVREEAARSLANLGERAAVAPLLEFLCQYQSSGPGPLPAASVVKFLCQNFPDETAMLAGWQALVAAADENFLTFLAKAMEQSAESLRQEWLTRLVAVPPAVKGVVAGLLVQLARCGLREPFRLEVNDRAIGRTLIRAAVARILGETGSGEFGEEIFVLLSDPEAQVRREAAWAAGQVPHFAAVDGLCQALSDPEATVRVEAARSLTRLLGQVQVTDEPEDAVRRLLEQVGACLLQAVNDPVEEVRIGVAHAMGAARVTAAVPPLVNWALGADNSELRQAAAGALSEIQDAAIRPLLENALATGTADERRRAAGLLGRLHESEAVPQLIRSLQDESAPVREAAGRALWDIGAAGHSDTLLLHLQSPDPKIRTSVAGLLGKVKAEEALNGLVGLLREPNEFVRAAVVNALANFGVDAREHLPALLERMSDPDDFVRARAARAIFAVGESEPEVREALMNAAREDEPQVFSAALLALVELASQGELEPLAAVLGEPKIRKAVAELLKQTEPVKLRQLLLVAQGAKHDTQLALLGLLTEAMKAVGDVSTYRQELDSLDPETRLAALEALAIFGNTEAAQIAARVLETDPVTRVRKRAAEILGHMPLEIAQQALRRAADEDLDPTVRESARGFVRLLG